MGVRLRKVNYQAFNQLIQWQRANPAYAKKMALRLSATHPKLGGDCLSLPCRFLFNEAMFRNEVGKLATQRDPIALEVMKSIRAFPKKEWKTIEHSPQIRYLDIEISSGGQNYQAERIELFINELKLEGESKIITIAYVVIFNKDAIRILPEGVAGYQQLDDTSHPNKQKHQRMRMSKLYNRVRHSIARDIAKGKRTFIQILELPTQIWETAPSITENRSGQPKYISLVNKLGESSLADIREIIENLLYKEGKIIGSVRDGGKRYKR